jgi:putative membrane protein
MMMFWGWDGENHMGAAGWTMMFVWAVFWVAVIVAIILLIRHLVIRSGDGRWEGGQRPEGPPPHHMWRRSEALNILEERYAKGEIDREEFLRKKADLG